MCPSFVDAMCELLAESLTDTDEEVSNQNVFNALLNSVTSFPTGASPTLLPSTHLRSLAHVRHGHPYPSHHTQLQPTSTFRLP